MLSDLYNSVQVLLEYLNKYKSVLMKQVNVKNGVLIKSLLWYKPVWYSNCRYESFESDIHHRWTMDIHFKFIMNIATDGKKME